MEHRTAAILSALLMNFMLMFTYIEFVQFTTQPSSSSSSSSLIIKFNSLASYEAANESDNDSKQINEWK
jgi:hypothetical protein